MTAKAATEFPASTKTVSLEFEFYEKQLFNLTVIPVQCAARRTLTLESLVLWDYRVKPDNDSKV